jgi:hypothetical protein
MPSKKYITLSVSYFHFATTVPVGLKFGLKEATQRQNLWWELRF